MKVTKKINESNLLKSRRKLYGSMSSITGSVTSRGDGYYKKGKFDSMKKHYQKDNR